MCIRDSLRAVAPGVRKLKSKIGARAGLFVVNEWLVHGGRSLDRLQQAETIVSYGGLTSDLGKLAAAHYLSELALAQALSGQPQPELFRLLTTCLGAIESLPNQPELTSVLALLCAGSLQLLQLAGVAPELTTCTLSQRLIVPDLADRTWRAGFSAIAGGLVDQVAIDESQAADTSQTLAEPGTRTPGARDPSQSPVGSRLGTGGRALRFSPLKLTARECWLLQTVGQRQDLMAVQALADPADQAAWSRLERALRQYAQYHLGQAIRSASLIDTLTSPPSS